jgi:hypothetical protein
MVVEKEASACEFDSHTPKTFLSNGSGVYEVGAFKARQFILPPKFNRSTKAECLIVSPNFINTLLAVVAVI